MNIEPYMIGLRHIQITPQRLYNELLSCLIRPRFQPQASQALPSSIQEVFEHSSVHAHSSPLPLSPSSAHTQPSGQKTPNHPQPQKEAQNPTADKNHHNDWIRRDQKEQESTKDDKTNINIRSKYTSSGRIIQRPSTQSVIKAPRRKVE